MDCEYGAAADTPFTLSAFAVHDPIERFISGVSELLERTHSRACPGGSCDSVLDPRDDLGDTQWRAACQIGSSMSAPGPQNFPPAVLPLLTWARQARCVLRAVVDSAGWRRHQKISPLRYAIAKGARFNLTAPLLPELIAAFVEDLTCCHVAYGMDDLQPQAAVHEL